MRSSWVILSAECGVWILALRSRFVSGLCRIRTFMLRVLIFCCERTGWVFSRSLSCKRAVSSLLGPCALLSACVVMFRRCSNNIHAIASLMYAEEEEKGFLHLTKSGGPRASCSPRYGHRGHPQTACPAGSAQAFYRAGFTQATCTVLCPLHQLCLSWSCYLCGVLLNSSPNAPSCQSLTNLERLFVLLLIDCLACVQPALPWCNCLAFSADDPSF